MSVKLKLYVFTAVDDWYQPAYIDTVTTTDFDVGLSLLMIAVQRFYDKNGKGKEPKLDWAKIDKQLKREGKTWYEPSDGLHICVKDCAIEVDLHVDSRRAKRFRESAD